MFRGYKDKNKNVVMDKEYLDHAVFNSLAEAAVFYSRLSSNVMSFVPLWVKNHTKTTSPHLHLYTDKNHHCSTSTFDFD